MGGQGAIQDEVQRERLARAIASDLLLYQAARIRGANSLEEVKSRIAAELEEGRALYVERTGDAGTRVDDALAALLPGALAMKDPQAGRLGLQDASTNKVGIWVWLIALAVLGLGIWFWQGGRS